MQDAKHGHDRRLSAGPYRFIDCRMTLTKAAAKVAARHLGDGIGLRAHDGLLRRLNLCRGGCRLASDGATLTGDYAPYG